jgi:putative membrane protein
MFVGLILFWLIPSIHFVAMLDVRLYRVMNWSVALNGLFFWNLVLNNFSLRPAGLSASARIAMMLAIIPPQIMIGALLFMTPHELYPIYTLCGRIFSMTPLVDQQIGGIILWIHGAMMSVVGILVVAANEWIKQPIRASMLAASLTPAGASQPTRDYPNCDE